MNNNYIISIPKNLKDIQSKLFFGLTKRQLIGFGLGITVGLIIFLLLKNISLDLAMYGLFFTVAPFIFFTIYKKDGMHIEKWVKLLIEQNYLNPQKRAYKVTALNKELAKERRIPVIEKRNKNRPNTKGIKENELVPGTSTIGKQKKK